MALTDTILINDGEATQAIADPADAAPDINTAIATLYAASPNGGKITILPSSTGFYDIKNTVGGIGIDARRANLTIELVSGTILRPLSGTVPTSGIIVCTLSGLTVRGPGTILVDQISCQNAIFVSAGETATVVDGAGIDIDGVRFCLVMTGSGTQPRGVYLKGKLLDSDSKTPITHTARIRDCKFEFHLDPAFNNIHAIDVVNYERVLVEGNTFSAFDTSNPELPANTNREGYCGTGIRLQNCAYSLVDGNITRFINYGDEFILLDTSTLVGTGASEEYPEGGHCVVTNNVSESGLMPYFVRSNADFVRICNNNIGRHDDSILARIKIEGKPDGTQSRDVTIAGNSMHVASGSSTTRYGIHVEDSDGVLIYGNSYYNMHKYGTFCRVEATATQVMFHPNSHLILPAPATATEPATGDAYTRCSWENRYGSEIQGNTYPDPVQGHGPLRAMEGTALE